MRNIADMSLYSKKSRPWNLTVVNENKVAITFPGFDKKVQFCQLKPSFSKVSSIVFRRTDGLKNPESIAYRPSDKTLAIGSCDQNEVCIFQLDQD